MKSLLGGKILSNSAKTSGSKSVGIISSGVSGISGVTSSDRLQANVKTASVNKRNMVFMIFRVFYNFLIL